MASATMSKTQLSTFQGMRSTTSLRSTQAKVAVPAFNRNRRAVVTQAGFLGSPNNLIMIATTTAFLSAGRFGLAPTSNKNATAGLKLVEADNVGGKPKREFNSNDPSGFSIIDVLGLGALGHVAGVGIILGLKATGKL